MPTKRHCGLAAHHCREGLCIAVPDCDLAVWPQSERVSIYYHNGSAALQGLRAYNKLSLRVSCNRIVSNSKDWHRCRCDTRGDADGFVANDDCRASSGGGHNNRHTIDRRGLPNSDRLSPDDNHGRSITWPPRLTLALICRLWLHGDYAISNSDRLRWSCRLLWSSCEIRIV